MAPPACVKVAENTPDASCPGAQSDAIMVARFDPFFAADIPQHTFDPDKAKFHLQKSGFSGTLPLSVSEVAFVGCTDAAALTCPRPVTTR